MQLHGTHYSGDFKAKATLSSVLESKTLAEIATEFQVHSTQITRWKLKLFENASELFRKGKLNFPATSSSVAYSLK